MQDPFKPLEIVATNSQFYDPAIDTDVPDAAERMARYHETRELDALAWKDGAERTLFVCKRLPAPYAACVLENLGGTMRWITAVAAGCHLVRLPGGKTMAPSKKPRPQSYGVEGAENAWLDELRDAFGIETLYEVGRVISEHANLPKDAKGPYFSPRG